MKTLKIFLSLSLILLLTSCGPRVQTVNPEDKSLDNYNTFAFLPNTNPEVPDKNYNDEEVNEIIVETVNDNMKRKGFEMDRDNPDLLVLISASTNTEVTTTADPVYATYPYNTTITRVSPFYRPYTYRGYATYTGIIGYDTNTRQYKDGTVVIDLIDRDTKETVWKGVARDEIYSQTDTGAILSLVDELFEEMPAN